MKVYAYSRVSGKAQILGTGFDRRQLDSIAAFCNKAGYTIEGVFEEQVSGTKGEDERDQFKAMVAAILKNGVNTIVVESLDRLAREYRIQEQLLIYLASKGITLITANTGENVTDAISQDPMRKAMIQIQGIFAELDKSLLVRKLRLSRERIRQEQGKCEGRKSYRDTTEGRIILNEIKKLRRKPIGKKRMTYEEIAEKLNVFGYKATNGEPFTGNTVSGILFRNR